MKKMDLFKIGMWIGMGATIGKWFGECINAALEGVSLGVIDGLTGFCNKHAQRACDIGGFSYKKVDDDHKKNESHKNNVQPIWTNLHDINEKEGGE